MVSSVGRFASGVRGALGDESEWGMDERDLHGVGRANGEDETESAAMEALRSFCRRFWNHIVTAFGSLS